ncbi:MAG: hypothetical protein R3F14_19005 [Polyangiaceae bacterium]
MGHTPSGDTPSVLCDDGFQLVIADSSYGRVEGGSQLAIDGERVTIAARAVLDDGREQAVRFETNGFAPTGPVGLRDAPSGRLLKGALPSGDYLAFRFLEGFVMEQLALSEERCAELALVVPRPG